MDNNNLNHLITSYNIHNPNYSSWDVQIMSNSNITENNIIIPTKNHFPDLFFPNHQPHDNNYLLNNNINIGQEIITLLEQEDHDQELEEKVLLLDGHDDHDGEDDDDQELGAMKEMMYKMAAMQPVDIDPATIRRPKRRNVRISEDPQSVAARHRRERISERIRILQRLVPGGTKMDTASMLDEAIKYVKFLKRQIRILQQQQSNNNNYNYIFPQLVGSGVINNNNNNNSHQQLILGTTTSSSESIWPGFPSAPNH